jgi:hypothetical protein
MEQDGAGGTAELGCVPSYSDHPDPTHNSGHRLYLETGPTPRQKNQPPVACVPPSLWASQGVGWGGRGHFPDEAAPFEQET